MIQAGFMKIKVKINDLSLDDTKQQKQAPVLKGSIKAGKSKHIRPEKDLRGLMVQEGCEEADKYLDDAYLASLSQVTLIHGKGTGALRSAIHTKLKKHPYVKEFRLGTYGEGEDGVTIVMLK
jgi:DNA mismatch repair protein MutS2